MEEALTVSPNRHRDRECRPQRLGAEKGSKLPRGVQVEGGKDEALLFREQRRKLLRVDVVHGWGTGTTAPVDALTRAASSAVAVATASWASTGGAFRPRTALAKVG